MDLREIVRQAQEIVRHSLDVEAPLPETLYICSMESWAVDFPNFTVFKMGDSRVVVMDSHRKSHFFNMLFQWEKRTPLVFSVLIDGSFKPA